MSIVLVSCTKEKPKEKPSDPITIGAVLPMTGDAAKYGVWMSQGMELAIEEINAKGGVKGRKLVLNVQDSKTNPSEGVSALRFMLTNSKPPVVLTTLTSVSKALIPITEAEEILLFANATLPGLTDGGKYVFRNVANLAGDVKTIANYCSEKMNNKPVAILWRNDDFGIWGSNKFKELYEKSGGQVVASESYNPDTKDFKTHILKISKGSPVAVYVLGYSESGLIIKQARELGHKWQFLGITTLGDLEVYMIAGNALEGAIFSESAFNFSESNELIAKYMEAYETKYGQKSEIWAATCYDAVKIFAAAYAKALDDSPESLRQALLAIKDFDGVSGKTTFLENGDVLKPINLKIITNGKPELL